jgi:hypothetical protein
MFTTHIASRSAAVLNVLSHPSVWTNVLYNGGLQPYANHACSICMLKFQARSFQPFDGLGSALG